MGAGVMDADWSVELGADDAVLEFPWSSPDGAQRYLDLQRHPELRAEIPEAVRFPELGEFLLVMNGSTTNWTKPKRSTTQSRSSVRMLTWSCVRMMRDFPLVGMSSV